MRIFIRKVIVFTFIPILFLELVFRITPYVKEKYEERINAYSKVDPSKPVKYIFIGTSRVQAAVMEEYFSKNDKEGFAINAGRGYSTPVVHYLGLKYLMEKKLANVKDALILIEMPLGNCIYSEGWETARWVNPHSPHLIIPYLDFKDLCQFWKKSTNTFATKLNVTMHYCFISYRYLNFIGAVIERNSFSDLLVKTGIIKSPGSKSSKEELIVEEGGIKADSTSLKRGRILAVKSYAEFENSLRLIKSEEYNHSLFNDMYQLSKSHGAKMGLFNIPLSSVQQGAYGSTLGRKNAEEFRKYILSNGISVLDIKFPTSDNDFPDLWHLSKSRADDYTRTMFDVIMNANSKPQKPATIITTSM